MINPKTLIVDFSRVATLAGISLPEEAVSFEVLLAPHCHPTTLPTGKMAVYVFLWGHQCLKVGKVGPRSQARYTSQHYNPKSSSSNLAKSILKEKEILSLAHLDEASVGKWIKNETDRMNILLDTTIGMPILSLLESFLQCRLRPRFERFDSQKRPLKH